jgi:cell division protein FtsL
LLVAQKRQQQPSFYDQQRTKRKTGLHKQHKLSVAARKLKMFAVVFILAIVSVALITHYTYMIQVNYQIERSLQELNSLQKAQQHLKLEIATLRSPDRLERIALDEIGMKYPDQDQFIILTAGAQVGNQDSF